MSKNEAMGYAVAAITIAAGIAALYTFFKDEVQAGAKAVGDAVNPTSDTNLAYRGTNAVGAVLTGDASFSLGSWLYDQFNPPYDPNATYAPRKLTVRAESKVYDYLAGNG